MGASILIAAAFGLGLTLLLIPVALRCACGTILLHRSSDWHHAHSVPVPRLGGAVLAVAFVAIEICLAAFRPGPGAAPGNDIILIGSLAMFALGFCDDLRPLGAGKKLLGQILIAGTVCLCGVGIDVWTLPLEGPTIRLGAWGPVITVVWLVVLTNLINLIDGLDGLAGGISLMLMVLLAFMGHQSGSFELMASGMAGALLGFLCFNFPPARVYLGDSGAYLLGFQVGLYSIANSQHGADFGALVAPIFVLALPVTDTVLTVIRRGLRGLPLFRPDRGHIHHRLLTMGFSPRRAVLSVYGLNLLFLLMGFAAYWSHAKWVPLLLAAAVLLLFACAGTFAFSRRWFAIRGVVRSSLMIRREIQYALALTRWLALESRRHSGPDALWPDLIFAADKLGFASVKLTLQGEHRLWQRLPQVAGAVRRYDCPNGHYGTIEFTAPACPLSRWTHGHSCNSQPDCAVRVRGCLAEPRVFEALSELLAEAWNKSAAYWSDLRVPLKFNDRKSKPQLTARVNGFAHGSFPSADGATVLVESEPKCHAEVS